MGESPVILAIETATGICGAAVADSSGVLAEAAIDSGLSHSSRLMELVRRALSGASIRLEDVDAIAVSVGPGSFTGIRIGMGAAIGLASGAGLPIVGVPTLDALARSQMPFHGFVCPYIDARRGEVYFCLYEASGEAIERVGDYSVLPPGAMVAELMEKIGPESEGREALLAGPSDVLGDTGVESVGRGRLSVAPAARSTPGPGPVATLGLELYEAGAAAPGTPKPLYVRRSDAELGQSKRR